MKKVLLTNIERKEIKLGDCVLPENGEDAVYLIQMINIPSITYWEYFINFTPILGFEVTTEIPEVENAPE